MKFYVRTNLNHAGTHYLPGDRVELGDEHAAALLSAGTITESADGGTVVEPETVTEVPATPAKPAAGGKVQETGEPSIDSAKPSKSDTAKDVTPKVTEPENDPSANL